MKDLYMENKEIILLALGFVVLALIIKFIINEIDKKTNTIKIKIIPKINLNIELHENGEESISYTYNKELISLNKIPKKITIDDFFNYLPQDIIIEYEYQITYINNKDDCSKRLGITNDIDEIKKTITNLKKYH